MLCLFIFILFVLSMIVVSVGSAQTNQMKRILAPIDQFGNFCGNDHGFERYKHLYFTKLAGTPSDILNSGLCVKYCPQASQQLSCPD
jgi:hypothetical protein